MLDWPIQKGIQLFFKCFGHYHVVRNQEAAFGSWEWVRPVVVWPQWWVVVDFWPSSWFGEIQLLSWLVVPNCGRADEFEKKTERYLQLNMCSAITSASQVAMTMSSGYDCWEARRRDKASACPKSFSFTCTTVKRQYSVVVAQRLILRMEVSGSWRACMKQWNLWTAERRARASCSMFNCSFSEMKSELRLYDRWLFQLYSDRNVKELRLRSSKHLSR